MSAYATKQDLIDRFGAQELIQRTDRTNRPQTTVDDDVVSDALNDAEAKINTYLMGNYTLPLAIVPASLVKPTSDIARFYLHGEAASETVRKAYEDAVKWLEGVAKGTVQLGVTTEGEVAAAPQGGPQTDTPPRIFSRDTMEGF